MPAPTVIVKPTASAPAAGSSAPSRDIVVDDVDSDDSFSVITLGYGTGLGNTTHAASWLTTFTPAQLTSIYFGDYLAPFRGLLRSLKDSPVQEQSKAISSLTKGINIILPSCTIFNQLSLGRSKKVLAITSGVYAVHEARQLISQAIQYLIHKEVLSYTAIPESSWVIVELNNPSDIDALVTQKLMVQQSRLPKKLVLFRRIITQSSLDRVIQVKNIRSVSELAEVKDKLAEEGITVVSEDPPEWSSTYTDRVVWKLTVPNAAYQIPTKITLNLRGSVQLQPAPLCGTCHSDDHHYTRCEWRAFINGT